MSFYPASRLNIIQVVTYITALRRFRHGFYSVIKYIDKYLFDLIRINTHIYWLAAVIMNNMHPARGLRPLLRQCDHLFEKLLQILPALPARTMRYASLPVTRITAVKVLPNVF